MSKLVCLQELNEFGEFACDVYINPAEVVTVAELRRDFTNETRKFTAITVKWGQKPRILFVTGTPAEVVGKLNGD